MSHHVSASTPSRATQLAGQIRKDWWWITISLVLFNILLSFFSEEINLKRLNLTFYDVQTSLMLAPDKRPNTALIIIDDDSINRIGYWPWRRSEYANALDYLHQAKAVGLDILLHDRNPAYPKDEQLLAYTIKEHGRVALPSVLNPQQTLAHFPLSILSEAAAAIGYINVYPDRDGVVRSVNLYSQLTAMLHPHFALALLKASGDKAAAQSIIQDPHNKTRLIPYLGPPGYFDTYSFADLVEGKYPEETFKDRYVLIGAWSSGLGDYYPTPLSTDTQPNMSGVEILANILENALSAHWVHTPPDWVNALINILPVIFVCFILRHLTPRRAIVSTSSVIALIFIGNWLLLNLFDIWIPPAAGLIGTLLAYPVWYWRSQETVLRYINNEISEMRLQNPALHLALIGESAYSSLPARLSHLHKAIELLREAQQNKEETLRFISHDMRAPQNSILALVKMRRSNDLVLNEAQILDRVASYASTTLELVDDFMDLARVEAMELEFDTIYLNDILSEACDDAWVRAQIKQISLQFDEPEHGAWVSVAAPLLKRAITNLIDNAIKYSSKNTTITCSVSLTSHHAVIKIADQGWGIAPDHLETIFQPFKRAHTDQIDSPTGIGLGLAFVHTVIARHFGTIEVQSKVDVGTTFTIQLPLAVEPN